MQDTHVCKRFHTGNGFLEIGVQINVKLQKVRMRIFLGKPATVTVLRSHKFSYLSREASGACISCNFSNPKIFRSHRSQWLPVRNHDGYSEIIGIVSEDKFHLLEVRSRMRIQIWRSDRRSWRGRLRIPRIDVLQKSVSLE